MQPLEAVHATGKTSRRKMVRGYDFRRPDKFGKDHVRTLYMLHENLGRLLASHFSGRLSALCQVNVLGVNQASYDEFAKTIDKAAAVAVISLPPLPGNVLLQLDAGIAFPIIDRLMGGPGQYPPVLRPATDIEKTVLEKLLEGSLDTFVEAWRRIARLSPRLESLETSPLVAQLIPANEIVAVISFSVLVGDYSGAMHLCLPFKVAEPVLPRLTAQEWITGDFRESPGKAAQALSDRVSGVHVPMIVLLGKTQLSMREFSELRLGDVLRLDNRWDRDLEVLVAGRSKFTARPGHLGRRLGFRITGATQAVDEEDQAREGWAWTDS
ncbi:MAG: flagellar motor switch protein FliM [Firmicutes bacterium]|nr:flagellar motor switch protein FliM [Bacillota bacterium]